MNGVFSGSSTAGGTVESDERRARPHADSGAATPPESHPSPMTQINGTTVDTAQRPASGMAPIVAVGLLAGFLAGLFGVGGGILIVPGLILAAHMTQRLAHGTSLAAVVPISVASLVSYAAHGNVDWGVAGWLAIGAVGGAVIGTRLLHVLPQRTLAIVFVVVLVASALRLFLASDADGRVELSPPRRSPWWSSGWSRASSPASSASAGESSWCRR